MKQLITILLTILSLTSYGQGGKFPINVSGSGGGSGTGGRFTTNDFGTLVDSATTNLYKIIVDTTVIASQARLSTMLALKLNIADTAGMLSGYQTAINARVKYTDTASMLAPYQAAINTGHAPTYFDVLATGQSNMVNNDVTIGTWTYTTNSRLQSFTQSNVFATANPATNNIDYIGGVSATRNNIGFQFGQRFIIENTTDTFRVLDRAQGSSGSWLWTPQTTGLGEVTSSNLLLDSIVSALSRAPSNFNAKVVLYQQGEADESTNAIYYLYNIFKIYDTLLTMPKIDDNFLFVIGYPTTTYPSIRTSLDSIYFGLKDLGGRNISVVPINTTTTNTIDGTHYTNEAIDYIGRWYYYIYQQGQLTLNRYDTTNAWVRTSLGIYTTSKAWVNGSSVRPYDVQLGVYSTVSGTDLARFSMLTTGSVGAHQSLRINDYSSTPNQISIYHESDNNAGNTSTFRNGIGFRDSTINILDSASRQSMLFGNTTITIGKPISSNSSISTSAGISSITNNITTASSNIAPLKLRSSVAGTGQSVGIEFGTSVSSIDAQIFGETGVKSGVGDLLIKTSTNLSTMVERLRITGTGLMGIGYAGPDWQFQVTDSSAANTRGIYSTVSNTSASGPFIALLKTRGTPNAPTAVTSGDVLGIIDWRGYIGATNTLSTGVRISGNAVGTVTDIASGLTANVTFTTRNRNGFAERWRIDTSGRWTNLAGEIASAYLHLKSGTTAAGTAPFKLAYQAPALNTTAEKYAVEVDSATGGGGLYYTSADAVRNKVGLAAYGELYEDGGSTAITVTTAGTYYQWASSTVGSSLLCTNSAATDNITVATGGDGTFLINASVSFVGTNSATQKWAVFKNGSRLTNLTSVVHNAGSALQVTTSLTGLVALAATDTIDLRVTSDTNGDTATPAQVNLNITRLSK